MGLVQLGINNALPATTDLIFGQAPGNYGGNGGAPRPARLQPNRQFAVELGTRAPAIITAASRTSSQHHEHAHHSTTPRGNSFTYYQGGETFDVPIGKLTIGTTAQVANSTDNIALVLSPTNQARWCSGIGLQPGRQRQYTLVADVEHLQRRDDDQRRRPLCGQRPDLLCHPANGTLNSATGVGPVVVNSGGTLGGSLVGGGRGHAQSPASNGPSPSTTAAPSPRPASTG